jgi:nucleotide-binding universal stress UspA family protein
VVGPPGQREMAMIQPVVCIYFSGQRPAAALARASALAMRYGSSLHVLLVSWEEALGSATSDDEAWLDDVLPRELVHRSRRTVGHLVQEAIKYALDQDAQLVVLPPAVGQSGSCVSAIVAAAGVPVLVACEATGGDSIVAATDLSDPRFPVVQLATEMIDHLETTLVGVHVVEGETSDTAIEQRRSVMATALEPISLSHEVVIELASDPAAAVLSAARERDSDMIVVGVPSRSWLDSLLHPTVASRIVAGAGRSVLLTPIKS